MGLELFKGFYDLCQPHSSLNSKKRDNGGKHVDVTLTIRCEITGHIWAVEEFTAFLLEQISTKCIILSYSGSKRILATWNYIPVQLSRTYWEQLCILMSTR